LEPGHEFSGGLCCEDGNQRYRDYEGAVPFCGVCHEDCDSCFGPLNNNCLACVVGLMFDTDLNNCYCPFGQYKDGNTCLECPQGCESCLSSAVCLTCDLNFDFIGDFCICSSDKYLDTTNPIHECRICQADCSECSAIDPCTNCSFDRILVAAACQPCAVNQGSFKSGISTCEACIPNCDTCLTNSECLICSSGFYYNGTECQLGPPCHESCLACDASDKDTCTQCNITDCIHFESGHCEACPAISNLNPLDSDF